MPRREQKPRPMAAGPTVVIEVTMPNGRTFTRKYTGTTGQAALNLTAKDFPRATVKVAHTRG